MSPAPSFFKDRKGEVPPASGLLLICVPATRKKTAVFPGQEISGVMRKPLFSAREKTRTGRYASAAFREKTAPDRLQAQTDTHIPRAYPETIS